MANFVSDGPRGKPSALIVEPDSEAFRLIADALPGAGFDLEREPVLAKAIGRLDGGAFDFVALAVEKTDHDVLNAVLERVPETPVIATVHTGEEGVAAVRAGASDFMRRPIDREEVVYVIGKALKGSEAIADAPPPSMVVQPHTVMIGTSDVMRELKSTLKRAAQGIATVLVRGESGSGKELVARQVHELSPRRAGPFVKVHCGALPDDLLESELFGYEKGAFTGATQRKPGRVELAQGGTLFLDEMGDITPAIQVKLLRILQDKEYERLGGTQTLSADVRFVAATHRDLEAMVREGTFREDLFYRLNVVTLVAPPLRARPEDIDSLAMYFCQTVGEANGRGRMSLEPDALDVLRTQPWPGNVRQLQNFIERLVVLASTPRLSKADVERELNRQTGTLGFAAADGLGPKVSPESDVIELSAALGKAEKRALEKALKSADGNRDVAARLLGISRRSLYYKLRQHGVG